MPPVWLAPIANGSVIAGRNAHAATSAFTPSTQNRELLLRIGSSTLFG
jgi:hypothetical protein